MPSASQASDPSRSSSSPLPFGLACRAALLTGLIWIFALAMGASTAAAKDTSVLDSQAASPGSVVEDGSGTAYVGWVHKSGSTSIANPPMFCKIPAGGTCTNPITLPIPGATSTSDEVNGVYPVLGAGATVYVVGPRYVDGDLVVWTSTNGGESFSAGTIYPKGYSDKTGPSNAVLFGASLLVGADNPGPGFSAAPATGGIEGGFGFESPGPGGAAAADLGLNSAGSLVEAYWNLSSPATVLFYRYKGIGPVDEETNWEGPISVTNGEEPRLTSGGAGGLFMVSLDYGGGSEPNLLEVRRYGGTSFGAPQTLTTKGAAGLFEAGSIAESPDGSHVAVVWPATSGGNPVMDLFTSTNGGASFGGASVIAPLIGVYSGSDSEVAIGNDGGVGSPTSMKVGCTSPISTRAPPCRPRPRPRRHRRPTREKRTPPLRRLGATS